LDPLRSSQLADPGVTFTTINTPLVRTPIIVPSQIDKNAPMLAPQEAADTIAQACIFKSLRPVTRLGVTGQVLHTVVLRAAQIVMSTGSRMFLDSPVAKGEKGAKPQLSAQALAMQQLMRGIHFQ
jgi:hypothetical protein